MRKVGIVVLGIVGAAVFYVLLVLDTAEIRHDWPDGAAAALIDRCVSTGGSENACRCVARGYQEHFSYDDFIEGDLDTNQELEILDECGL